MRWDRLDGVGRHGRSSLLKWGMLEHEGMRGTGAIRLITERLRFEMVGGQGAWVIVREQGGVGDRPVGDVAPHRP